LRRTMERRPDLLSKAELTDEDRRFLSSHGMDLLV
jgi:tRNA G37 N-methylase TrmD